MASDYNSVLKRLPRRLRPLFWDTEFGRLLWRRDGDFIIGRVLAVGDWDSLRRGAGLSARQLCFWRLILDLPRRDVTA